VIRPATSQDVATLVELVRELAEYERSPDSVELVPEQLDAVLFGDSPTVFAHVAEVEGRIVGMAIWFLNFSTWTGRNGIYLEDLYVRPAARGRGIGRALLAELAAVAHRSGYGRVDWAVLNWNETALRLYRSLGAAPLDEWTSYRLAGPELAGLADEAPTPG
jgi:GNAT superfamily N-acetyltransferase